jgi:hypothetical protein
MDPTPKRNFTKLGIFMLVAACIPLLLFSLPLDDPVGVVSIPWVAIVYASFCLVALIWGGIRIWLLPLNGLRRAAIFIVWAILYPLLCAGWYLLGLLYLSFVLKFVHR